MFLEINSHSSIAKDYDRIVNNDLAEVVEAVNAASTSPAMFAKDHMAWQGILDWHDT